MLKSNESKRTDENIFFVQTHEIQETIASSQRHLKGSFISVQKQQTNSYIKDLEASVAINKGIIADLISQNSSKLDSAKLISKLNEESKRISEQLKECQKERNELQMKLLISEQLLEEQKKREKIALKEYEEKKADWLDQLDRKEYILQIYGKMIARAVSTLKPIASRNVLVLKAIENLEENVDDSGRIANIVLEKEALEKKLKEEQQKTINMQKQVNELIKMTVCNTKRTKENRIPLGQVTNKILNNAKNCENSEKNILESKITQLKKEISQLYRLNQELSNALYKVTKREKTRKRATSNELKKNSPLFDKASFDINEKTVVVDFKIKPEPSF